MIYQNAISTLAWTRMSGYFVTSTTLFVINTTLMAA